MRFFLPFAAVLALAACSDPAPPPKPAPDAKPLPEAPAEDDKATDADATNPPPLQGGGDAWRAVANAEDADRIARLDQAWRTALREAGDQNGAVIDAQGMVLVQQAGLEGALQPPPGDYRCRTFKLGSITGGTLTYVDYPWFKCRIELTAGGDLTLTKTTGSQRTQGLLYPDSDKRLVFIGAQAWGADETGYPTYGQMPERDQIGVFERIGENRWRLVLPWPKQEAKLEILELRK